MTLIWQGKTTCDLCGQDVGSELVDGKTVFGPWATMCLACNAENGVGLGTGRGQLYYKTQNQEYEKVNGL